MFITIPAKVIITKITKSPRRVKHDEPRLKFLTDVVPWRRSNLDQNLYLATEVEISLLSEVKNSPQGMVHNFEPTCNSNVN